MPGVTSYGRAFSGPDLPLVALDTVDADPVIHLPTGDGKAFLYSTSPDGTIVAFAYEGTAVDAARFDFVATASGDVISTVEFTPQVTLDRVGTVLWSPDSRAFLFLMNSGRYLHRIGGQTVFFEHTGQGHIAFASNEGLTQAIACEAGSSAERGPHIAVAAVADGAGEGSLVIDESVACDRITQLFSDDGDPIALAATSGTRTEAGLIFVLASGASPNVINLPEEFALAAGAYNLAGCGKVAFLSGPPLQVLVDLATGRFLNISDMKVAVSGGRPETCPVFSADRELAAYETIGGAVAVADFSTGQAITVANSGHPVAFSASNTKLLVDGGGTYIVNVDSSGGDAASVQAAKGGITTRSYCRAGDSGQVAVFLNPGVAMLDIDADASYATEGFALAESCSVSTDGRWFASGVLVVDLDSEESWTLPAIGVPNGERVPVDNLAPGQVGYHGWLDGQTVAAALASR